MVFSSNNTTAFLQQGESRGNPILSFYGGGSGFGSLGALRRDTANHTAALQGPVVNQGCDGRVDSRDERRNGERLEGRDTNSSTVLKDDEGMESLVHPSATAIGNEFIQVQNYDCSHQGNSSACVKNYLEDFSLKWMEYLRNDRAHLKLPLKNVAASSVSKLVK
ncbi:hypothetical protein TNCV_1077221 [Trichonephila clavipes]|uniref:Uncharacterized protein n=1 Tax=Trichonephila clavipes TaxID=2585209 RepID=A0A8X6UY88_TRICX|nr:hypothetical protein TNCV_1077221 [Trichonephila clavipes]